MREVRKEARNKPTASGTSKRRGDVFLEMQTQRKIHVSLIKKNQRKACDNKPEQFLHPSIQLQIWLIF